MNSKWLSGAVWFGICLMIALPSRSQRIRYSAIENDDYRQMNFEVIGRVGANINVYKNFRTKNDLSVYDDDMKLVDKVSLDFLPDKLISVDFVAYPQYFYMIYQYQKRNIVYCEAAAFNGNGKMIREPVELDTSQLNTFSDNKVYAVVNSDDKSKIMVFKINKSQNSRHVFTTLLYNDTLKLLKKSVIPMSSMDKDDVFTEFMIDNEGDLAFGVCGRDGGGRDYFNQFRMVAKTAYGDSFLVKKIALNDKRLDEVRIKTDNLNKEIVASSFYYKQRKGNIEGIWNVVLDKDSLIQIAESDFPFNDSLKVEAKSENTSVKNAFNDYFIKHLIVKRDGGFVVLGEAYYTNSRYNNWNRYDYLYGYNYLTPLDYWYYSPYNSYSYWRGFDPWNRWNSYSTTRHYYEDVAIFSFDRNANLEWINFVRKSQYDDNTDMFLSYQLFISGSEAHFLYNQIERHELMLNDQTVNREGQVKRYPTLRNLDKGYEFMPRFGKQVGPRQIVIPCMFKNFICFAKIDF